MNIDKAQGAARQAAGGMKNTFGQATNNQGMAAEGAVEEAIGGAQKAYGQAKDTLGKAADNAAGLAQAVSAEGGKAISRQVEEQPYVALSIAAALGFLLARSL